MQKTLQASHEDPRARNPPYRHGGGTLRLFGEMDCFPCRMISSPWLGVQFRHVLGLHRRGNPPERLLLPRQRNPPGTGCARTPLTSGLSGRPCSCRQRDDVLSLRGSNRPIACGITFCAKRSIVRKQQLGCGVPKLQRRSGCVRMLRQMVRSEAVS